MPTTEELKLVIKTVADTTGAAQVNQALQQTQSAAKQAGQQLTTAQQGANAMLRAVLSQQGATLNNFTTAAKAIRASTGTAPTLTAKQLGLDSQQVQETANAGVATARSLASIGAAAGIAGVAADQLANRIGDLVGVYASAIDAARTHERVTRSTAMAYGAAAGQFQKFAEQLSATTGFTSDAILEAALSARTLSQNYGLTIEQTQKLIRVSADLARVRGIGIAEAFERVQSAIRGEAEASEYLGLTLNDTYLTNQAMNGSLKTTFGTMSDLEKAQVRYNELLKQSAQFTDLASKNSDSLDAAFGRAENSARRLQIAFGEFAKGPTLAGLAVLERASRAAAEVFEGSDRGAVRFRRFLEELGKGESLVGAATKAQDFAFPQVTVISNQLADLKDKADKAATAVRSALYPYLDPKVKDAYTKQQSQLSAQQRRLQEINELPTRDTAAELARLAHLDQVDAAVRDLTNAQQAQVDLQHQSVDLASQEASIRLSMLPTQERLAAAQRDVAEAQIRARQAALPASEALEDLRYEQERARLIVQNRGTSVEERIAARRQLRDLARAEPGVALTALQAGRPVTLAGRAAERVGLEAQLADITQERALAQVRLAEETNKLLSTIAGQRTQAIELTINLSGEAFSQEVYQQLIEANNQAQTPTTIPQSGVRR